MGWFRLLNCLKSRIICGFVYLKQLSGTFNKTSVGEVQLLHADKEFRVFSIENKTESSGIPKGQIGSIQ